MRRFSPLSSVAIRVDGSVTGRNFSVSRYGAARFLKISEPQVKSGNAGFASGIPSGVAARRPLVGGDARSGRQCSRPRIELGSYDQPGRCALAARLARAVAGIGPQTARALPYAPQPGRFFAPPPQAQSPGATPAASCNFLLRKARAFGKYWNWSCHSAGGPTPRHSAFESAMPLASLPLGWSMPIP